jgi:hypothetical protein
MRKIKRKEKPIDNSPKNIEGIFTKRVKIFAAIVVILVILSGAVIYIEDTDSKIVIKNNTDLKLEYVKASYTGPDMQFYDGIKKKNIAAGKTATVNQDPINLFNAEASMEIRFKFENHEVMYVDAGLFNDNFSGKVTITFNETKDGKVKLNVKAKSGVINSSRINCDDTFTINLNENHVEF